MRISGYIPVVEIRAARDEDLGAITSITNYYIETSTIHFAHEPVTRASFHELWITSRDRFPWLVAEDAGAVVGYAKAGRWRDRAAYDWTAEVAVYLRQDAHRRGVGRALYSELLAELARRGFRSAIAGIALPNEASLALHRALGFELVGTVRDAGWKHGRWCDVSFWQKRLATGPDAPPRP
jgi:phosphinothricin acetyltransferase